MTCGDLRQGGREPLLVQENRKTVARFQSELSFRILQEIHRNTETPFCPGGDLD